MNQTLETIRTRQSIRKYKPNPIPPDHLHWILEAARLAPTGGNRQKWRMIVITDPELRRQTAHACNGQDWIASAPVVLCLATLPGEGKVNGTIVLDHAILAATSLGYGTCWIGAYDAAQVKTLLDIPEDHGIVCLTPVGIPAEQPPVRSRKQPTELFMQERFGVPLDYSI
jgi:nitroreductase